MTKRIIVIGAGFAGLMSALAAKRLINMNFQQTSEPAEDIEVVVIAPEEKLVVRPRLYEENVADMSAPLGQLFNTTGVRFLQGNVESIEVETQQVVSVNVTGVRSTIGYDRLVLAAGSDNILPASVPGLKEHSFAVDHLERAVQLEEHLKNLPLLPAALARNTIVVCGGGYTGLELAAELPGRLAKITGLGSDTRVIVIERADVIGPDLPVDMRPLVLQTLERLGVEVKLGTAITGIDAGGVTTSAGEHIETLTPVWTAGTVATPLTQQIPGEKDAFGRLMVETDLRCPQAKAVFAAGDTACARTDDHSDDDDDDDAAATHPQYTKMSCQHAMPMGRYAGHNAAADLLGRPTLRYSQVMLGTVLDLGRDDAVFVARCGDEAAIALSGAAAKPLKRWINETLIYPPSADDLAGALEAGNPANRTVIPAGLGC
ncbi:FAD-containing subunit of NADH dehydrogenase [Apiospora rasikravindrae]|uniref:FAD-containing subunit of NADH dehydrogenase n=1 Tax=Apiospora rasikravindrae TaxID=990691 RepID=A0ABR1SEA4_9PEZI